MPSTPPIKHILSQHAEEAAFLWLIREAAVHQPHYDLPDLIELDERIEAHLDGLRIAGEAGWEQVKAALSWEEPGEVFAAAVLAFESGLKDRIEAVLKVGLSQPELTRALIAALGWLPRDTVLHQTYPLIETAQVEKRYLGLATFAVHRENPGYRLDSAIKDEEISLRTRALRLAGELGRHDLLPQIHQQFQAADEATRFWAAWAGTLLGDRQHGLEILKTFSLSPSPFQMRALSIFMRCLESSKAIGWLRLLAQKPELLRPFIIAIGIVGNPQHIPWLLEHIEQPEVARIAGESFTFITGAHLDDEDLEGDAPKGFEAGPTENPEDEEVALDPDEDLLWPEPTLVKAWWQQHQKEYHFQTRYLVGQPITVQHCEQVLKTGLQRERLAAALELALMQPSTPLFEIRAPGLRQQHLLQSS